MLNEEIFSSTSVLYVQSCVMLVLKVYYYNSYLMNRLKYVYRNMVGPCYVNLVPPPIWVRLIPRNRKQINLTNLRKSLK